MWRCRLHCLFIYLQVHLLGGTVRQQPLALHLVVVMGRDRDHRPLYLTPLFHHKDKFILAFLFIEIPSSLWKMVAAKPPFRCDYLGLPDLAEYPRSHSLLRTELPDILKFCSFLKSRSNITSTWTHCCFPREVLLFFCVLRRIFHINSTIV